MKRAVVIGSAGQDGRILVERLAKDAIVVGIDLGGVTNHGFDGDVARVDLSDAAQVDALVSRVAPDEVYYLAARHHSSEELPDDASELRLCLAVHVDGWLNVLEALRRHAPACHVFYAGSSHMFGNPHEPTQSETTPFAPRNPYAITKVTGAQIAALYRARGMHVSVGILYNHESPLRGPQFVTQRIVRAARQAALDPTHKIAIGNLSAIVDWGYAPDYVDAMLRILAQPTPDDYVIATGVPHSVKDFAAAAFESVNLDWRDHIEEVATLVKTPSRTLVGDAAKLRARTGWAPTMTFETMVKSLVSSSGRF